MLRTEAGVVKRTREVLEEYEQNPDVLMKLGIAERVMTRMLLAEMKNVIAPFTTSQSVATQLTLKPLEDFLRKCNRLLLGKPIGTPLLYCYQPTSLISRSCIALAEDLATIFPYPPLKLLLPKVIIPDNFKTKYYNNFVVTPDGYLIGVIEGLDAVRNRKDHRYVHPATGNDLDPDLLLEHSGSASTYAAKIRNLLRPKPQDIAECDLVRTELETYIEESQTYHRSKPAYKEAGKSQVMAMITKKIHTPQQLAELMAAYVPKAEWVEFLRAISRDDFYRIFIPKRSQTIQKKEQSDDEYKKEQAVLAFPVLTELTGSVFPWPQSDNAKRILVYAWVFLAYDLRSDGPDFYKYGAGYLSALTGQISKTDVLKQLQTMLDFLMSNDEQYQDMRDIEKYFADKAVVFASTTCLHLKGKIIDAGRQSTLNVEARPASVAAAPVR